MSPRPTIAFDLDGTLVDTAPDLLGALNFVLGEIGLAPLGEGQVRSLVGGGARLMIERGLAIHGVEREPDEVDKMLADFLVFYERHIADRSRPFPGAAEMLDEFAAQNARLVIVTNKFERYSIQLLTVLGLAGRFSVIAGPDTFGLRKPDPGHLLRTVERANGESAHTIMVGDTTTDVATARAAGVPVIAVSFGYRDREAAALDADHIVDRLDEIPAAAYRLLARATIR
jgi:phosphoglycolate phosphatase